MDKIELELKAQFVAALDGDEFAYRRFLRGLSVLVRSYLRHRLRQWPDEVEDLVQDTLIAVHDRRHTYRRGEPLTSWVRAIARYKLVDFWRRHERREALHDPLDEESPLLASAGPDAADTGRDLAGLLDQLPIHHRLPIVHMRLQGRTARETALLTGMSESAVKVGVHRGLKALERQCRGLT